jgi:Animal haem peroxidase
MVTRARRTPAILATACSRARSVTATLAALLAQYIDQSIGWARLPKAIGLAVLVGLRHQLRTSNLYAAEPAPIPPSGPAATSMAGTAATSTAGTAGEGNYLVARTRDGSYNDLKDPRMGAVGCRFGRNVPPAYSYPESAQRLLDPNPRLISRALLTRDSFQPATTLNLLAAAWIQFEVHDWFAHGTVTTQPWVVPLRDDDPWPQRPMRVERTPPDPHPSPVGPPTFITTESHWWDASQIYGTTPEFASALRAPEGGKLRIDDSGLPPREVEALADLTGTAGNFWVGLALLHSLFMREHNAICEHLTRAYPYLTGQQLYDKARLVNSALMAKIHTVDWTPAIIAHPTTVTAMRVNWFGLLGERLAPQFRRSFGRISSSPLLHGIPGSPTTHRGVPYSLTEEFVAVYRMHPLIPDEFTFRSLADDHVTAQHELPELSVLNVRARLAETPMADLFYSFGRAHPGTLSLHNFPRHLQHMHRVDGTLIDLATIDLLRSRERGVPRYNEFRKLFRLKPARTFEELTGETELAAELREIYDDVDLVDLMIGLYAEPKPPGFGFSDTAFRVFILMATRRLESDRFFTADFRDETYTCAGMNWIRDNDMRSVLLRHFPELAPAMAGVANPFAPWNPLR